MDVNVMMITLDSFKINSHKKGNNAAKIKELMRVKDKENTL